ncbi:MAG: hypothetical protein JWN17_949, partial [Frankiales bacterium]|nr:hypothetical protein [Frankiales bacterium]
GGRFVADGLAERFVRVPYSLPPEDLRAAVTALAAAVADLRPAAATTTARRVAVA